MIVLICPVLCLFYLCSSGPFDAPPQEKKYKPLNTPSNSAKEIKVKIIPAQRKHEHTCRLIPSVNEVTVMKHLWSSFLITCVVTAAMECTGFLDALNSAPVPGIKIKKKKPGTGSPASTKAVSPTSNKVAVMMLYAT